MMQKHVAELMSYLDATRERLVSTLAAIDPAFAGINPRPGTWSVEQNVSHLAVTENRVAQLIAKSVDWATANGIGPETSEESFMATLDQYGVAKATFKREAPATVVPDDKAIAESLASLTASRIRLKEAFLGGSGLDLRQVSRSHPALGEINLYQWALFIGQHEERHRRQIEHTLDEVMRLAAESAPIV